MVRFLAWVERTGNKLPDPVFIFFYLIVALMGLSVVLAALGLSAPLPTKLDDAGNPVILQAVSLFARKQSQTGADIQIVTRFDFRNELLDRTDLTFVGSAS